MSFNIRSYKIFKKMRVKYDTSGFWGTWGIPTVLHCIYVFLPKINIRKLNYLNIILLWHIIERYRVSTYIYMYSLLVVC